MKPVFSGPSGRKPGRRFRSGSGDYVDPLDPIGQWSDTLMRPQHGAFTGSVDKAFERALGNVVEGAFVAPGEEAYPIPMVLREFEAMGTSRENFLRMNDRDQRQLTKELKRRLRARRKMGKLEESIRDLR